MTTWTAETWMRQRGTWPTSARTLQRDLHMSLHHAYTALGRLADRGVAIRVARGKYVHRDHLTRESTMTTLFLYDAAGAERHRVAFPTPQRADIALRIVERDLQAGRTRVRIVGAEMTDPMYSVDDVARALVKPAIVDLPDAGAAPTTFDARARAAGDDQ